jgi:hypothetical protein
MARYDITHACGHQQTHQITGPDTRPWPGAMTRREYIAQQRASRPCDDCARTARNEQRTAETLAAADTARDAGFPPLTGSDKQTAWAERIRSATLNEIDNALANWPQVAEPARAIMLAAISRLTDASWWIEHRSSARRSVTDTLTDDEQAALQNLTQLAQQLPKENA